MSEVAPRPSAPTAVEDHEIPPEDVAAEDGVTQQPPTKIVVNDVTSAAEARAQDIADDRFNAETETESVEPLDFGESKLQKARAFIGTLGRTVKTRVKEAVLHPKKETTRIWRRTFDTHYRRKYRREALDEILSESNIFIDREGGEQATAQLRETVVERSEHRDAQQMLATEQGERLERLDDQEDGPAREVHNQLVGLVSKIATGELTEDNFSEEADRLLSELAREHPDLMGKGKMFADNLLEVAQGVAQTVDHLEGEERLELLEATLSGIETHVGESSLGQRTEARYTRADKIVQKIEDMPLGNVAAVATIASATFAMGRVLTQKGTSAAIRATAIFGGFMVGAGAVAGMKRSKEIADDRAQHARDRAAGEEFDPHAKRRGKLEQARYETVSASDLYGAMQTLFEQSDDGELRQLRELNPRGFHQALMLLAEMKVRDQMSDEKAIDLVHFSDVTKIDQERFELLQTEIYAEDALQAFFEEHADEIRAAVGIPEGQEVSFEQMLELYSQATEARIEEDISDKDRVFKKLKFKEVALAGLTGATVAGVVGSLAQEVTAELPITGRNVHGIFEDQPADGKSTLLAGLLRERDSAGFTGNLTDVGGSGRFADVEGFTPKQSSDGSWFIEQDGTGKTIDLDYGSDGSLTDASKDALQAAGFTIDAKEISGELSGEMQKFEFGRNTFVFPEEYQLQEVTHGEWNILDQNGDVIDTMHLNFDGSVTQASIDQLQANGIGISDVSELVETTETTTVPTGDHLVMNHLDETTAVHRVLWYGNDTPAPNFDLNELRTHAGGPADSWFNDQGDVVLDITAMKPNWSFQDGQSVNPFDAVNEGRLSLAVSATKNTQSQVFDFEFSTTPEGRTIATIPTGSPVHQLFGEQNGERTFSGAYFEVMEHTGQTGPKGEDVKILGTYVGTNDAGNLTDTVSTTAEFHTTTLDITPPDETVEVIAYQPTPGVEVPPVVPLTMRRGLETPRQGTPERPPYYYGEYGPQTPEEISELLRDVIPVLHEDPRRLVPTDEAVNWYNQLVRQRQGEDYVEEIEESIESSPELKAIDKNTKAIVAIPVAATVDGGNIYETLSLYGQQSEEDQQSSTILLHVNWPQVEGGTTEGQEAINLTLSEIERAKAAFPGLKIAVVQSQLTQAQMNGGAVGHVVRRLFDTAILATKKAVDEGRVDNDQEIVLIRNDADAKGIASGYISRMVDSVKQPDTDAAAGRIRWGIEQLKGLPGLSVTMQIYEGIRGSAERARAKGINASVETIGINTGVRLSTLAAVGSIGFGSYTGAGSDDLTVGGRINAVRRLSSPTNRSLLYRLSRGTLGRRRGAGFDAEGSAYERVTGDTDESTINIANGATIDSDVSRLEGQYRRGEPVTGAWGDFDAGGHKPRTAGIPEGATNESLRTDFDQIVDRIEFQVNQIVKNWGVDPRHAEMEFRRMFPANGDDEEPMYETIIGTDGSVTFSFTESGRKLLEKRMTRNNTGQFDPIGSRRLRTNYGRSTARRRFASGRTPRLIGALS